MTGRAPFACPYCGGLIWCDRPHACHGSKAWPEPKERPMHKITLHLSDEEYAALEQRAKAERRSVREMAEYLVVQKPLIRLQGQIAPIQPAPFNPAPFNPLQPPNVWCGTTTNGTNGPPTLQLPTAGHQI